MNRLGTVSAVLVVLLAGVSATASPPAKPAMLRYLSGPSASLIAFAPTNWDPRPATRRRPSAESIRKDLEALRPAFNGLVTYGYDKDITPVVIREAVRQRYSAMLLGIWDVKSRTEREGIVRLAKQYWNKLAIGIVVGNEGITFRRYTSKDVETAAALLKKSLGDLPVPLTTSEPYSAYSRKFLQDFGDFLAPNIHPVFDRPDLKDPVKAVAWVKERAAALSRRAGKPLLVKETGFPHAHQHFSKDLQARFWRAYLSHRRILPLNGGLWVSCTCAFEAFDQPFKAQSTGIEFEDDWGLLSSTRSVHPAYDECLLARRKALVRDYIREEMDRWTRGTVVYDDRDSGGIAFYPSNWFGDTADLTMTDNWLKNAVNGTCAKITYRPKGPKKFAGIHWVYPDGNRGTARGRDLSGATKLSGWVRGRGIVELKIGGINPAFGPFALKPLRLKLTENWRRFEIPIPKSARLQNVIGGLAAVFAQPYNPTGAELYLDEVGYNDAKPNGLRLIRSYRPARSGRENSIVNGAFLYDNAVCLLHFLSRSDAESRRRARILADTFCWIQSHDRTFKDGRFRNAYSCGPIADPATNSARLPGFYDSKAKVWAEDMYSVSSDTGNNAWAIIALLGAHRKLAAGKRTSPYLEAAVRCADWIERQFRVNDVLGGYSGGFEGWESRSGKPGPRKLLWRSTEHSIDLAVAFSQLSAATGEKKWAERARHARRFVLSMWQRDHFWTGTKDAKGTINKDAVPADAQTWAVLALAHDAEFRRTIGWMDRKSIPICLKWAQKHCSDKSGGVSGYRFSNRGTGIWPEGSGHIAACYRLLQKPSEARAELISVARLALSAKNHAKGIQASYGGSADTGFIKQFGKRPQDVKKWIYPPEPHLGASVWFLMAVNPYWIDRPLARISAFPQAPVAGKRLAISTIGRDPVRLRYEFRLKATTIDKDHMP